MRRAYKVVDVFTDRPLLGNPVAVVLDAQGLDSTAMQSIARWTNLSETTFVLPPTMADADYRLRIFTPRSELPFAGHPTLGSAHALIESGRVAPKDGRVIQECGSGLVNIHVNSAGSQTTLALELPRATVTALPLDDVDELEAILGQQVVREIAPAIVEVGAIWIVAKIASLQQLLNLKLDLARSANFERRLRVTGLSIFADSDDAIEVRSFAPSCGVDEDPVCGSGNGSIAVFRKARGLLPANGASYIARQGRCIGRDGRVAITVDATGQVTVGGSCVTCVNGMLHV